MIARSYGMILIKTKRCLIFMIRIIKKIPLVIPIFAFMNIAAVKIMECIRWNSSLALKITTFIFNPKNPFYFNYQLIYMFAAVIISIVLAFFKRYTVRHAFICIGINSLLFIVFFMCIITGM